MTRTAFHGTERWKRKRLAQLRAEPLCRMCKAAGRITAATVADHVEPHRGDAEAFWTGELQSLCTTCHSSHKQAEEVNGYSSAIGTDGWPVDLRHPANGGGGSRSLGPLARDRSRPHVRNAAH
jgi:5-methylcytosine-specific restriction protein A